MGIAEDYLDQMRQLLPPGPAWDKAFGDEVDQVLQGLAPEFARVDARGDDLLAEMYPATLRELLTDWERVMQLPDPCLGDSQGFEERRTAVVRRMIVGGGQSALYFEGIAISMGYPDAEVTRHRAPRFGSARFGRDRFGTWSQQFFWTLQLGTPRPGGRRFGVSVWGERFGSNPNEGIECVVRRWAPAHTIVNFEYD